VSVRESCMTYSGTGDIFRIGGEVDMMMTRELVMVLSWLICLR